MKPQTKIVKSEIGSPEHLDGPKKPLPSIPNLLYRTTIISNQLACVQIVVSLYYFLKDLNDTNRSADIYIKNVLLTISLGLLACAFLTKIKLRIFFQYYSAIIVYTFMFTPVLLTLTRSISSDTVLRLIMLFLFCHLLTYNYFSENVSNSEDIEEENNFKPSIYSTNFATLAIIFMISRFEKPESSSTEVFKNKSIFNFFPNSYDLMYTKSFTLIIISVELLLLWPIVRSRLTAENHFRIGLALNLAMIIYAQVQAFQTSRISSVVGLFLHLIIYFSLKFLIFFDRKYRQYQVIDVGPRKPPLLYQKLEL